MSVKNSVPLSNFSICLASIIRYVLNSKHPHPLKKGKGVLVDYNLVILMIPTLISGSMFGATLNTFLPDILITIMWLIMQCFMNAITIYNFVR